MGVPLLMTEERDAYRDTLKAAFVAGCVEMLNWLHAAMPQDDLDESGYDYADSVLRAFDPFACALCALGFDPFNAEGIMWHQVNGRDPFRCTADGAIHRTGELRHPFHGLHRS